MFSAWKRNSWFITVPLVALTAVYGFFYYLPHCDEHQRLIDELTALKASIAEANNIATKISNAEQELEQTQRYVERRQKRLVEEHAVHRLFGRVTEAAHQAGAVINQFDPDSAETLSLLKRIPLSLGCTGTFEQLWTFLNNLERLGATIWVDKLHLTSMGKNREPVQCEADLVLFTRYSDNSN